MIKLGLIFFLFSSIAYGKMYAPRAVYGEDNRQDIYEVRNPLYLELARSTAGLVDNYLLKKNKNALTYSIDTEQLYNLEKGIKLCSSEKFSQQYMLTSCSGFLIAEDKMVTAGHCYDSFEEEEACNSASWVFDLNMDGPEYINLEEIPADNVYHCKKVIKLATDGALDFAIIELDRKVMGRTPLKFRTEGKISDDAELVTIGHPSMLPTKVTAGGMILENQDSFEFIANLDTFQGNSGSAVFDAQTGQLEGILTSGKTDYVMSSENGQSCQVVNRCDENGLNCTGKDHGSLFITGESVLRISALTKFLYNHLDGLTDGSLTFINPLC